MKGAIWSPSSSQLLPIPSILPISNISYLSLSDDHGLIVSEKNELFELSISSLSIQLIPTSFPISTVTCFNSISILIGSGQVYIYGSDIEKTGLLGQEVDEIQTPKNLQIKAFIIKGSLNNHAAVIDNEGKLYTWGKGINGQLGRSEKNETEPGLVDTKNLFRASEVVCGDNFTGILTDGCYVYVYGSIGNKENSRKSLKKNLPSSHPELERMTVIQIAAGIDFISVLIENGEVFAYDSCMDLVKLPLPQNVSIASIACTRHMVYGIGESEIVEWGCGLRKSESNYCELTTWNGRYYKLEKPYSQKTRIFSSSGKHFSMAFQGRAAGAMPLGIKAHVINPYKWSKYSSKIIENVFESLEPSSVPRASRLSGENNFGDLERLYAIGDNENTIRKIIKYRKEHELTKHIHKVFWGKVQVLLDFGFRAVKEQSAMKKLYNKTLAAALLTRPIEKMLQRNLTGCCLFALKALNCYSVGVRNLEQLESERINKLAQEKEEKLRKLLEICCGKYYKHLHSAFFLVKELEMTRLQKKTAVLSFGQVIFSNLKASKKQVLKLLRHNVSSFNSFKRLITRIILSAYRKSFHIIIQSSKSRIIRSNTFNKAVLKKQKARELKMRFLTWKKNVEANKNLELKKKFNQKIGCKSLTLVLNFAIIKNCKGSFSVIKAYRPRNYRTPLILLANKVKLIILRVKKDTLNFFQSLVCQEKCLKKLFKFIKKHKKQYKRQAFKKIEFYSVAAHKARNLKSFLNLHSTLSALFKNRVQFGYNILKSKPKEANLIIADGPSYSFYSPKFVKQSGILRQKNPSVGFVESETKSYSDFNFVAEMRLKKQKSFTSSMSISLNKNSTLTNSSLDLKLGKSLECSLLEKTLQNRKIKEQSNKNLKNSAKPPLKPPWKPASTTTQKKIVINSNIRRSQYDNRLKERVKCHSKQPSTDGSHYSSTPTISSRASSRQKIQSKGVEKFQNYFTNLKFGVLILDNLRLSVVNKRLFESWCRVKYYHKHSPVPPAPRPLDTKPQVSWQSNLYKIGFENLKHLTRICIGRQILTAIKVQISNS